MNLIIRIVDIVFLRFWLLVEIPELAIIFAKALIIIIIN